MPPPIMGADGSASEPLPPHPLPRRYFSSEPERRQQVGAWFNQAAPDYDWITQAMSFGFGHWYRRQVLLRAALASGMKVLDLGSGTGVLAAHAQSIVGREGGVVALDPSFGMLRRAADRGVRRRVRAIGEALPFGEQRFDFLSMGYALRHVADLRTTFREYRRVLRDGGKLLLLELTPPRGRIAFRLVELYLGRVVPLLARLRGGPTSQLLMEYFWETIARCVPPPVILDALSQAGFSAVSRRVERGILSEYSAVR
ncbi:MAG TPA: class I SAM-dependent methyltransferase [Thermoanaerobaculia bacterium]|nr:class I SAM-dependent methyltransferase [Thermoanaerobaculia bacterium]